MRKCNIAPELLFRSSIMKNRYLNRRSRTARIRAEQFLWTPRKFPRSDTPVSATKQSPLQLAVACSKIHNSHPKTSFLFRDKNFFWIIGSSINYRTWFRVRTMGQAVNLAPNVRLAANDTTVGVLGLLAEMKFGELGLR